MIGMMPMAHDRLEMRCVLSLALALDEADCAVTNHSGIDWGLICEKGELLVGYAANGLRSGGCSVSKKGIGFCRISFCLFDYYYLFIGC